MQNCRRFKNLARWACTVAAVVVLGVWVGSGWYTAGYNAGTSEHAFGPSIYRGRTDVFSSRPWEASQLGGYFRDYTFSQERIPLWSFGLWRPKPGAWVFSIPLWAPFLATTIPAALLWRSHRKDIHRARAGLCPTCHYDRRGLPPGSACPQCGAA